MLAHTDPGAADSHRLGKADTMVPYHGSGILSQPGTLCRVAPVAVVSMAYVAADREHGVLSFLRHVAVCSGLRA
jgi:hypothetical protein